MLQAPVSLHGTKTTKLIFDEGNSWSFSETSRNNDIFGSNLNRPRRTRKDIKAPHYVIYSSFFYFLFLISLHSTNLPEYYATPARKVSPLTTALRILPVTWTRSSKASAARLKKGTRHTALRTNSRLHTETPAVATLRSCRKCWGRRGWVSFMNGLAAGEGERKLQ
jgi:hypothetical protein